MTIRKSVFELVLAVFTCFSQINISGKVTDTSGVTPLSGAVVKLEKLGLADTTNTDGSFAFAGTGIKSNSNQLQSFTLSASIGNGVLYLHLQEKGGIEIITYTLQGKAVFRVKKVMDIGAHNIAQPHLGNGVYFYKIKAGNSELTIKSPSIGRVSGRALSLQGIPSSASLANRYVPIDDVIAVTTEGYLNYRVIVTNSDTTNIKIRMIVCADTVRDADGNLYQAVQIGNQVWTVENLRTTKYNDNTPITLAPSNATWASATTEKFCFYNNTTNADSIKKYGALYNWHAVNTKKLAPAGWHVPADTEWDTLQNYLIANGYNWDGTTDSNRIAKSLAAMTDWKTNSVTGTIGKDLRKNNRSGFSALPGSSRTRYGQFGIFGQHGSWWSSTEIDSATAFNCYLHYDTDYLRRHDLLIKSCGFSVRIVRDLY